MASTTYGRTYIRTYYRPAHHSSTDNMLITIQKQLDEQSGAVMQVKMVTAQDCHLSKTAK